MEAAYIVLGLFGAGYYLNKNGKTPRQNYLTDESIDPELLPYSDTIHHKNIQNTYSATSTSSIPVNIQNTNQPVNFNDSRNVDRMTGHVNTHIGPKQEQAPIFKPTPNVYTPVSYTHLRAHET